MDLNTIDDNGLAPLDYAVFYGLEDLFKILIYKGAKPRTETLVRAYQCGQFDMLTTMYRMMLALNQVVDYDLMAKSFKGDNKGYIECGCKLFDICVKYYKFVNTATFKL